MDKKKKKLTEEALSEVGTAQPVPATSQEVAAATPATTAPSTPAAPAQEDPVDVVATPQVPADDSPAIDPLAPPAEGMVPTGWAYPEDLAAAVAMATGDVEAAGTAADATVTDEPLVSEDPVEGTEPVSVTPQTTDDLSMEEKQLIMDFRKKKLQEADESDLDNAGLPPVEDVMITASDPVEDTAPVEAPEAEDAEPSIDINTILAAVDAVFGDEECEECEEKEEEEEEEGEAPDGEDEECEECEEDSKNEDESSVEDVSQTLGKLSHVLDFLNNTDSDDLDSMNADTPEITKSEVDKAFDFLSALEDNIFSDEGEDEDEESEEEDFEEDSSFVDDEEAPEAEEEEASEDIVPPSVIKEAIKYPAGSAPKSSAIAASAAGATSVDNGEDDAEDDFKEDLVRAYEKKSRARREALNNFRESLVQKRKEGSKFNEALNSSSDTNEVPSANGKSWSSNTFMAKYNESRKLNWKELFDKGLLG